MYTRLGPNMTGKLYHRVKKNGKWTWTPCFDEFAAKLRHSTCDCNHEILPNMPCKHEGEQ